jgi:hypothetical protein
MSEMKKQHVGIALVFLLCLLSAAPSSGRAATPGLDEVIAAIGFGPDVKAKLLAGEIIAKEWTELSAKELALGLALYLPAPPEEVAAHVQQASWLTSDPAVKAFGELAREAGPEAFAALGYARDQEGEPARLAAGKPGDSFNLDASEWAAFKSALGSAGKKEAPAAASAAWREVLARRHKDYATGGLAAIRPYDRGSGQSTSPGKGLAAASADMPLLKRYFPEFQALLAGYPKGLTPQVTDRLFWIESTVEDRPCFVLSHLLSMQSGKAVVLAHRQYYVAHSYNSLQALVGLMPAEGGSILFYLNRTSTDQVEGFPEAVRHNMGREAMQKAVTAIFERLKKQLGGS